MGKDSKVNNINVYTVIIHYAQVEMLKNPLSFAIARLAFRAVPSSGDTKSRQK